MRVRVSHDIRDLADDCAAVVKRAPRDERDVVKDGIRVGNSLARDFARESAGAHGKHYHRAFTTEMHGFRGGFGAYLISGEYGPDAARPQGNMSFEYGSRNQKPHLDLARSADFIVPAFVGEVRRLPDRWFW